MKLSRRGKRTNHARRGKHTKRVRKHHTRRIKHRGKQYKRTYRKNNRKLKHNKRIQRGGVIVWTSSDNNVTYQATGFNLTYQKKGTIVFKSPESPFSATLTKQDTDNEERVNFTVTLRRETQPTRTFIIYVKLGMYSVYFSTSRPFEASDSKILLTKPLKIWRFKLNKLEFKNENDELYDFSCNDSNLVFFTSLAQKMTEMKDAANAAADLAAAAASAAPAPAAPAAAAASAAPAHVLDTAAAAATAATANTPEAIAGKDIIDGIKNGQISVTINGKIPVNYIKFRDDLKRNVAAIEREMTGTGVSEDKMQYKKDALNDLKSAEETILGNMLNLMIYIKLKGGNIYVIDENADIPARDLVELIQKQQKELKGIRDEFMQKVQHFVWIHPQYQ